MIIAAKASTSSSRRCAETGSPPSSFANSGNDPFGARPDQGDAALRRWRDVGESLEHLAIGSAGRGAFRNDVSADRYLPASSALKSEITRTSQVALMRRRPRRSASASAAGVENRARSSSRPSSRLISLPDRLDARRSRLRISIASASEVEATAFAGETHVRPLFDEFLGQSEVVDIVDATIDQSEDFSLVCRHFREVPQAFRVVDIVGFRGLFVTYSGPVKGDALRWIGRHVAVIARS